MLNTLQTIPGKKYNILTILLSIAFVVIPIYQHLSTLSDIILHITKISLSSILKRYSNDAVKSPLLNVAAGGITLASL